MLPQYLRGGPLSPRPSSRALSPGAVFGSRAGSSRPTRQLPTGLASGAKIPTSIGSLPLLPTSTTANPQAPVHSESRMQYIPYERTYIDYESREYIDKVPIERTVIDYKQVKKIEYVPRQKQVTDYYAVEYQTTYVPQTIPEKKIQYVPVETVSERVEYYPVEKQVVHYPEETVDLGRRRPVGGQVPQGLTRTSSMGSVIPRPSSHYAGISSTIPTTTVTVNAPGEIVTTTVNQTYYAQPPSTGYIQPQSSAGTLAYVNSSANDFSIPYSNNYTYTVHGPSDIQRKFMSSNGAYGSIQQQRLNGGDYQMGSPLSNGIRVTQTQYPI